MAGQREIPVWEKYTLTIEEAARYFRIGENKLRRLVDETPGADWVLMNGKGGRLMGVVLSCDKYAEVSKGK